MFTAEQCHRQAEECERNAGRADFSYTREGMLMLARRWRELAEEREKKPQLAKAA